MKRSLRGPLLVMLLLLPGCLEDDPYAGPWGCTEPEETAEPDPTPAIEPDEDPICGSILAVYPGPEDVERTRRIVCSWDTTPLNGALSVTVDEVPFEGTTSTADGGRTLVFDLDDPLPSDSIASVLIEQDCSDPVGYSFSTGPWGPPVAPESVSFDRPFVLSLDTWDLRTPQGPESEDVLRLLRSTGYFAVQLDGDLDSGSPELAFACVRSDSNSWIVNEVMVTSASWDNPAISSTGGRWTGEDDTHRVVTDQVEIELLAGPGVADLAGEFLSARVDVRTLAGAPGALCTDYPDLCGPCDDDVEACFDLVAEGFHAGREETIDLLP